MNLVERKQEYLNLKKQATYLTIKSSYENQQNDEIGCNHDIIILLGYNNELPIYKCIVCGEDVYEDIENKIVIDASNYNASIFDLSKENDVSSKYEVVKNHIIKTLSYNPGITNGQLEMRINQSINGQSYQKRMVS